jgi:hypothetical protein
VQIKLAFRHGGQADGQSYTGNNATRRLGKSEEAHGPSVGAGRAGDICTVIKEALIPGDPDHAGHLRGVTDAMILLSVSEVQSSVDFTDASIFTSEIWPPGTCL